jgi:hypothetical protein
MPRRPALTAGAKREKYGGGGETMPSPISGDVLNPCLPDIVSFGPAVRGEFCRHRKKSGPSSDVSNPCDGRT